MDWSGVVSAIPDAVKSLFGLIDKAVPDATERDKIKLSILQGVMGTGSSHWLQANAFPIAMLTNFFLVVGLSLMGKPVPEWCIYVALLWLAGPLASNMTKEGRQSVENMAKRHKEGEQK
ncbi:hypothetical protein [Thiocapsa sp. N5-Cardenillas]|uniref:hypothetical protein n=1 Tax=Thiocapsa sp. N5-Cardenillas TaxID=3137397 RepID=UPI0035B35AFF